MVPNVLEGALKRRPQRKLQSVAESAGLDVIAVMIPLRHWEVYTDVSGQTHQSVETMPS